MEYKYNVFLSYSRKDFDIMARVRDDLRAGGLTVWTDEYLELETPTWEQDFVEAVKISQCCVVILSPDANGSEVVEKQLKQVEAQGLRIFPVIGRGDEWSAIPKQFIGKQMIDVRANHEARMQRLIELIRIHLHIDQ